MSLYIFNLFLPGFMSNVHRAVNKYQYRCGKIIDLLFNDIILGRLDDLRGPGPEYNIVELKISSVGICILYAYNRYLPGYLLCYIPRWLGIKGQCANRL